MESGKPSSTASSPSPAPAGAVSAATSTSPSSSPVKLASAPQFSPAPSSASVESHVEAVLTGMNRFAALSRAFVKTSSSSGGSNTNIGAAVSSASPSVLRKETSPSGREESGAAASSNALVLSSSGGAKSARVLAAGTSLMDRLQPVLSTSTSPSLPEASGSAAAAAGSTHAAATTTSSSSLPDGHVALLKNTDAPTSLHISGKNEFVAADGTAASLTSNAAIVAPTAKSPSSCSPTSTTQTSKLYRPPHARDDATRRTPQLQQQLLSSSPSHSPAQQTSSLSAGTRSPALLLGSSSDAYGRSTSNAAPLTRTMPGTNNSANNPHATDGGSTTQPLPSANLSTVRSPSSSPTTIAAAWTSASSAPANKLSPSSTSTTSTITMATRLREGAASGNNSSISNINTFLPPSLCGASEGGNGDLTTAVPQHAASHRDASTDSHHSSSARAENNSCNGASSSYLAVARRAGDASASATQAPVSSGRTPEKQPPPHQFQHQQQQPTLSASPSPPSSSSSMPTAATAHITTDTVMEEKMHHVSAPLADSLSDYTAVPSATAAATTETASLTTTAADPSASTTTAQAPSKPLENLTAEEVSAPSKLSRSAKRKRKLRAVRAAATAAAHAETQGSENPLPASSATAVSKRSVLVTDEVSITGEAGKQPNITPALASSVAASTSGNSASAANTCGVSRRPGWHPSLAVASVMANGESSAEMAASYVNANPLASGGCVSSSNNSVGASLMMTYAGSYVNPAAGTTTTVNSGASSVCGSARHEPVNRNAHFVQQQQQQQQQQQPNHHHHYHNHYVYSNHSQQQISTYKATNHSTSPGRQRVLGSAAETASSGSGVGSGAAGTMFDPNTSTTSATRETTNGASPTRGSTTLHRGCGVGLSAVHGQPSSTTTGTTSGSNVSTAVAAAMTSRPSRLASSPGALLLQNGRFPTIRVGTVGTLANAPMPCRNTLTLTSTGSNSNNNSNNASSSSHLENTRNTGGAKNIASVGSPTSAVSTTAVPRHHHHQHHSTVAFLVPARHPRTSSSFSGSGSPTAALSAANNTTAVTAAMRSRGDGVAMEMKDTDYNNSSETENANEYSEYISNQQQQQQELQLRLSQQEVLHAGEWSTSPLTPSTLHGATASWGGPTNVAAAKPGLGGANSGNAVGPKMKLGGNNPNNVNNGNSRTSNAGCNSNAANVYVPNSSNHNPAVAGGVGGTGMNTLGSFRSVGVGQAGRYGGNGGAGHPYSLQQQLQHGSTNNYVNQGLYADLGEGGMMSISNSNTMGQTIGNRRRTAPNQSSNNSFLQTPAPYYDFISVLPTFVSACLTLRPEDEAAREQLCWTIEAVLRRSLTKNAEIRVHGSITTGLALPSSDVDVLVVGYQPTAPLDALQTLSKALIELDEASLKEALEFQESVEQEKQRQKLAEQHQQQEAEEKQESNATSGTGAISTENKETAEQQNEGDASASCNSQEPQPRHPSKNTSTNLNNTSSAAATALETTSAKAENGEVSVLWTNVLPVTVEQARSDSAEGHAAVVSVLPVHTAAAVEATTKTPASAAMASFAVDGRKAFLTAAANYLDDDESPVPYSSPKGDDGNVLSAGKTAAATAPTVVGRGGGSGFGCSFKNTRISGGRSYSDLDTIAAAEKTEMYDTVDDIEQAEEVFRDQIEKDYSFSTTLDISTLFAPVMNSGANGGGGGKKSGITPKMLSSPSPLNGPVPLPPPPSLSSAHASAMRDRKGGAAVAANGPYTTFSASFSASSSSPSASTTTTSWSSADDRSVSAEECGVQHTTGTRTGDEGVEEHYRSTQDGTGEEASVRKVQPKEDGARAEKTIARREGEARQNTEETATPTTTTASKTVMNVPTNTNTASLTEQAHRTQHSASTAQECAHARIATTVAHPSVGRTGGHLTFVPVHDGQYFYVQSITATRVPVIKLTDKATNTKVDITFAGGEHWRSMQLTRSLLDVFPQARPLILFLKFCVRSLGVGESEPGGVTSFTIYLMVLHFYNECRKRVISILQEREAAAAAAAAATTAGSYNDSTYTSSGSGVGVGSGIMNANTARADEKAISSAPLPQLPAQEQQLSVSSGNGGVHASTAVSPTTAFSTVSAASHTPITAASAQAAAIPLDLGLLEHFLGDYLERVEQRHAQILEAKAAAAATESQNAANNESAETTVTDSKASTATTGEERTNSPSVKGSVVRNRGSGNSRSSSVGACATIRAAYNSADKAHLQTIREMILGFVGKSSTEVMGTPTGSATHDSKSDQHRQEKQQPSSSPLSAQGNGGVGMAIAAFGANSSSLPQGAFDVGLSDAGSNNNGCNNSVIVAAVAAANVENRAGGEGRSRHAPPLHHYLLKTVEPQPHERSPAAAAPTAADAATPTVTKPGEGEKAKVEAAGSDGGRNAEEGYHTTATLVEESKPAVFPRTVGKTETSLVAVETVETINRGDVAAAVVAADFSDSIEMMSKEEKGVEADICVPENTEEHVTPPNISKTAHQHKGNEEGKAEFGGGASTAAKVKEEAGQETVKRRVEDEKLSNSASSATAAMSSKPTSAEAYDKFAEDFLQRQVNVSDLFLDFCHYYGCAFDYETCGIRFSIDGHSEVVDKPYLCSRRGQHFHLTSPFDPEYDLTARMTHMRDFQWLCWWFTEWGAARQAPMYYGGCSLQYVLQCLSPQTAEADCLAVHHALVAQAMTAARDAARRTRENNDNVKGGGGSTSAYSPSSLNYPAQQQQFGTTYGGAAEDAYMSARSGGHDLSPEAMHMRHRYAATSTYGQPIIQDASSYQHQQHHQQYAMPLADDGSVLNTNYDDEDVRNCDAASAANNTAAPALFAELSDSSCYASESIQTESNMSAHRRGQQEQQLPFVDSHDALEGLMTYGTVATSPTTNGHAATTATTTATSTTLGEEEDGDREDEVPAFNNTTTRDSSTHEEATANSLLDAFHEDPVSGGQIEAIDDNNSSTHPLRNQEDDVDEMEDMVGLSGTSESEEAAMEAMMAMPCTEDGPRGQAQMPIYANDYPVRNYQQQQRQQQQYRRSYRNETAYYDVQQQQQHQPPPPQQRQQAGEAAAYYYQAYPNMNNAYTQQQQQQQPQQQQYDLSTAQNFYVPSQVMMYPSHHMMYQLQQQHVAAAAAAAAVARSNAANYPFPFLHYDVQQYLWMQEQQQRQQLMNNGAMRRTVSREQEGEVNSTSDTTAPFSGSPPVVPTRSAFPPSQQQQQYYPGYAMYPIMYNDVVWNHTASASGVAALSAGGNGNGSGVGPQPSMPLSMNTFPNSSNAAMHQPERGNASGEVSLQQQQAQQGGRGGGGHPRAVPRRHVSVYEAHSPITGPQQQQQHPSHPRPTTKRHHHTDPLSSVAAAAIVQNKQEGKAASAKDVEDDVPAKRRPAQGLPPTNSDESVRGQQHQQQRSQHGTPAAVSPSLSPIAVPRPRTQSLPSQ